jgi:hypothetical protein
MDEVWRYIRRFVREKIESRRAMRRLERDALARGGPLGIVAVFVGAVAVWLLVAAVRDPPKINSPKLALEFALFVLVVLAAAAVVAVLCYKWQTQWWPRLRAWVRPHHIVKAILAVAVAALIAAFWWPYPGAVPAHRDRLATIHHVYVVVTILVATLFINPGPMLAPRDRNTVQVRRVAGGLACLAVIAFVVKSMADDLGSFAAVRGFFTEIIYQFQFHPVRAGPYVALPVLAVISAYRVAVGLRGPFPRDPMHLGKSVLRHAGP